MPVSLHDRGRGLETPKLKAEMRYLDEEKWSFEESKHDRIGRIESERR